ncbi:glycoside hydrolase family 3 protein [Lactarius hengduanensis]|nr:glycoside hydrolase family 3 protein [Lactarius hengduanensis]
MSTNIRQEHYSSVAWKGGLSNVRADRRKASAPIGVEVAADSWARTSAHDWDGSRKRSGYPFTTPDRETYDEVIGAAAAGLVSAFSVARSNDAGTQFPGAMALAAAGSPDVAERIAEASALELKLAGINWAYSPVGDVNSDPRDPAIGSFLSTCHRAFSHTPPLAGVRPGGGLKYVTAVCRGLTKAGIASSVKHFPGHGDTHIDTHSSPKTTLFPSERRPMPASRPSCLSDTVALWSPIVSKWRPSQCARAGVPAAAVDALRAGADIAMICHRIDRQRGALEAAYGAPGHAELRASGQHIAALKDAFAGGWEQVLGREFSDEAGWARLVRNPSAVVPLPKSGATVVLTPRMESLNLAVDDDDADRQRPARKNTAGPRSANAHEPFGGAELQDAPSVLFVTRNADRSTWQLGRESRRVVVLASYAPYDLLAAPPDMEGLRDVGYVASFEFTAGALDAAAAVIFGEEVAKGKVEQMYSLIGVVVASTLVVYAS